MIDQRDRRSAAETAVENYYDDVYRFCRYYTGNEEDSYDITQEVFLRYLKYADGCKHRNLKAYLIMIARNLCCDHFRRQAVQRENTISLESMTDAVNNNIDAVMGESANYGRSIEDCDNELFLRELLQGIPQEQREVVIMRIHDGLKFREIARITGCSLPTAKTRFRLGIAGIRKKM